MLYAAQSSDLVTAAEDMMTTGNPAVKPELTSTESACAAVETDIAACHIQEHDNSLDILGGLRVRLVEVGEDSNTPIKPTSGFDPSRNAESSENCTSDSMISVSHSPSNEALDLTGSARKRKLDVSNYTATSKDVRLGELQAPANDVDDCSESSSVVCVKDEILTSADIDADWSASLNASVPLQGNCLNSRNCHKASTSLDNANSSNWLTEEDANASLCQSDQVVSVVRIVNCGFLK